MLVTHAIDGLANNAKLALDKLPLNVIEAAGAQEILDIHGVFLPNTMRTILGLHRRPEVRSNQGGRSGEGRMALGEEAGGGGRARE